MAICQACSTEIVGQDRFCRKCGAPAATSVGDLVDTYRFNPPAPPSATAQPGSQDPANPFYAPPPAAYAAVQGSSPLYQTASVGKKLIQRKAVWLVISLLLFVSIAAGIGIRTMDSFRDRQAYQAEEDAALAHRSLEEAVQNALGFKEGSFSESEFPEIHGIFVNHLMSDTSPAALANIQAGDVLTELNDQVVSNDSDLARVLNSLKTGAEVPVKFYRDGEIVATRIKIADRSFAPFQPKIEPRDQGYLGIKDAGRRCCVPGTKKWGVEIREIVDNTPVDIAGLQPSDVVTEFNGRPVRTPHEFNRFIRAVKPRSKVSVKFYRGNAEQTVELSLGHRW